MVHKKYIKITVLPIALKLHQKSKHWDTFAQFSFSIVDFADGKYEIFCLVYSFILVSMITKWILTEG